AVVVPEQVRRVYHLAQDGAAAEQVHTRLLRGAPRCLRQPVHALEYVRLHALGHGRVGIVLVHDGDVIEHVLVIHVHAPHAVLDDHRELVGVGRVVGNAVRNGAGEDVAVAVLVLQTFTGEGGAPGGAAHQEPPRLDVARGPGEVADALETEHGVEDV